MVFKKELIKTTLIMKVILKIKKEMVKVYFIMKMEICILVIGKMIKLMVMVITTIPMVIIIKVNL